MSISEDQVLQVLFNLASQKKAIPYSDVMSELSLTEDELEDKLTTLILNGSVNIRLDQTRKLIISRMNPFVYYLTFVIHNCLPTIDDP